MPAEMMRTFLLFLALACSSNAQIIKNAHCDMGEAGNIEIFEIEEDGVIGTYITGKLSGFEQTDFATLHGFHVHQFGDLTDGCASCGGHFNPYSQNHGGPNSNERHVGDLGNIMVTAEGVADFQIYDHLIKLAGPEEFSILGRSIVIHAKEDDFGASGDPSGNAGARIMCCIIKED